MQHAPSLFKRLNLYWEKGIWQTSSLEDRSVRGLFSAFLRVLSISWTVFGETKAASRAAALSYSSMLGLGPLVAIAMLVAGFVLDSKDPDLAVNTLNKIIHFIAPQVSQYEQISADGQTTLGSGEAGGQVEVNPELVNLINGFIKGSQSGAAGTLGALSLIFVVLMLFTSVENAFNEIWGVRRGRSWLLRIVFYWTILTLGAVLFFASLTALGAGAFVNVFVEKLPFGDRLLGLLRWLLPLGSAAVLVLVLTLFYRYIPNTHVYWRAALIGAVVVAGLVFLNNTMAFFYFRRVLQSRSLYGSVGIVPILMLGLYVFWLFVLVGGQVSYAIQNVHFRNSQAAWGQLAETMREKLSLAVLLAVARRFQACEEPYTASALGDRMRVPTQIINECLNRLIDMKLITPIPSKTKSASTDYRYQPARPLDRITLHEFKHLDDNYGDNGGLTGLSRLDPVVASYEGTLEASTTGAFFRQPLSILIEQHPFENPTNTDTTRLPKA